MTLNRHWTIHHERAGIGNRDGGAFVRSILKRLGESVRRSGLGTMAAIWVRENGSGKGAHVHILLHLPRGYTLRNRTRGWIEAAGGTYRKRVSKVRTIGGQLSRAEKGTAHYTVNAANVLAYILKGADTRTGQELGLDRYGQGGPIIGKRCGWTQNIGGGQRNL